MCEAQQACARSGLTWLLWAHEMVFGGSGKCLTTHVKLIVEPMPMYKSGAPTIVVIGSIADSFAVIPVNVTQ